jgi:hypothetical protein
MECAGNRDGAGNERCMPDNLVTIHGNDPDAASGMIVVFVAELAVKGGIEQGTDGVVLGGGELLVG